MWAQSTQQRGEVTTSAFTRQALTNENAAGWLTKLGLAAGSANRITNLTLVTGTNINGTYSNGTFVGSFSGGTFTGGTNNNGTFSNGTYTGGTFTGGTNVSGVFSNGTYNGVTTLQSNLVIKGPSPWVDVTAFGAAINGSTDDSTAFANAIASLPTTGGTILVSGQAGIGSSGILISNKSNIHIVGLGPKAGIKSLANGGNTILTAGVATLAIKSSTNCSVEGLYIDMNSTTNIAVGIASSQDCVIKDNTVVSSGGLLAVGSWGGSRNKIINNNISAGVNSSRGIWVGNTQSGEMENDATIYGNIIKNMPATGINFAGTNALIQLNTVISNAGSGIVVSEGNGFRGSFASIIGNTIRSNLFHGIQSDSATAFGSGGYTEWVVVEGNIVKENLQSGIYAVKAKHWDVIGNVVVDNNSDASGNGYGITLNQAQGINVTGNTVGDTRTGASRTQQKGIYAETASGANDIKDIQILNNYAFNNTQDGISVVSVTPGTVSNVRIQGNNCVSNTTYGIVVADAIAGEITDIDVVMNSALGNGTQVSIDATVPVISALNRTTTGLTNSVFNGNLQASTWLRFGTASSSDPAIKKSSSTLEVRLADDSNYAALTTGPVFVVGNVTANTTTKYDWSGRSVMRSASDGTITFQNQAETGFTQQNYGGNTATFPAVALSSAGLIVRGADGNQSLTNFVQTSQFRLVGMTKAQRDALSNPAPVAGTVIYQTDNTPGLRTFDGTNWKRYTETTD